MIVCFGSGFWGRTEKEIHLAIHAWAPSARFFKSMDVWVCVYTVCMLLSACSYQPLLLKYPTECSGTKGPIPWDKCIQGYGGLETPPVLLHRAEYWSAGVLGRFSCTFLLLDTLNSAVHAAYRQHSPKHQSPGEAVMLKPADFNGMPSASLSGLFSATNGFSSPALYLEKKYQELGQH